jgi:hypothetical protein
MDVALVVDAAVLDRLLLTAESIPRAPNVPRDTLIWVNAALQRQAAGALARCGVDHDI